MRVLVTGATGFIGSHVVEALVTRGLSVRTLIRRGRTGTSWIDQLDVERVEGDPFSSADLEMALDNVTHVIHLAGTTKARRTAEYTRGNVDLTRSILNAAVRQGRLQRFSYISSLTAVGPSADGALLDEDTPCAPLTAYGRSKREAETLCLDVRDRLPITIIRPPAVYGPRDRDTLEMFRWVGYGIKPLIGSSQKSLSLIHVKDLSSAILSATFDERAAGRTYFATDPKAHSFNEVVELIAGIVHRRPIPIRFPIPLLFSVAAIVEAVSFLGPRPAVLSLDKARDMVQTHWVCSAERIRRELGFTTSIPLASGLAETYTWYRQHRWL